MGQFYQFKYSRRSVCIRLYYRFVGSGRQRTGHVGGGARSVYRVPER